MTPFLPLQAEQRKGGLLVRQPGRVLVRRLFVVTTFYGACGDRPRPATFPLHTPVETGTPPRVAFPEQEDWLQHNTPHFRKQEGADIIISFGGKRPTALQNIAFEVFLEDIFPLPPFPLRFFPVFERVEAIR